MDLKEQTRAWLNAKHLQYRWIDHAAAFTVSDMQVIALKDQRYIAKNLFLRDDKKKHYYLYVCPLLQAIDLKKLRQQMQTRPLSFASLEDLQRYLHLEKGSVTPLGICWDEDHLVEVWIDQAFYDLKMIAVHPCVNTATVFLQTEAFMNALGEVGNTIKIVSNEER